MLTLKEVSERAQLGDLLLIEGTGKQNSILLCEYSELKMHHPRWNNLYEINWRKGGNIGFLQIIGDALEITPDKKYGVYDKGNFLSFPRNITDEEAGVKNFELGNTSIINRLKEIGLPHYAGAIQQGGLITSEDVQKFKRSWNSPSNWFRQPPRSLRFKKEVLKEILI